MDPVPLDPDLVARFKDKTMAIVGYESDQGQKLVVFQALNHSLVDSANKDLRAFHTTVLTI